MTVAGKIILTLRCRSSAYHDSYDRLPTAAQFQGKGGPEDKVNIESENRPGDQDTLNLQDLKRRGVAQ